MNIPTKYSRKFLVLFFPLLSFSITPSVYAEVSSSWLGKYEGEATACRGDMLIVAQDSITIQSCRYTINKIIVANQNELTLQLNPGSNCKTQETVVTLKKPTGTAVDLYNYRSVENYKKNYSPNQCGYGPRMK